MKNGISLVSLIITIIVIIIITTTVILYAGGENSIINRAKTAVEEDKAAKLQEQSINWKMEIKTKVALGSLSFSEINTELTKKLSELKTKGLLTQEEVDLISANQNKEITKCNRLISFNIEENTDNTDNITVITNLYRTDAQYFINGEYKTDCSSLKKGDSLVIYFIAQGHQTTTFTFRRENTQIMMEGVELDNTFYVDIDCTREADFYMNGEVAMFYKIPDVKGNITLTVGAYPIVP